MHPNIVLPLAALGALLAWVSPAHAAGAPSDSGRFVYPELKFGREKHRFAVWLPPGYESQRSWPGIVFLHGSGECGSDGVKPVQIGLGPALRAHPERWPFVIVFPQKPTEIVEWEETEALVFKVLDKSVREFHIDKHRVALGGMSQGAHGVWFIGARHPERWRCLFPICGYGRARTVSPRVATLPVWAFHGLKDDLVDPADTQKIIAELIVDKKKLGLDTTSVKMTLYPDANHDSWDPACAEPELPVWIRAQTK